VWETRNGFFLVADNVALPAGLRIWAMLRPASAISATGASS
jgi:hypothetical protein